MKVLFMFGGLPHYYNMVLNRLNDLNNFEITVVIPEIKSSSIGEGVHQTDSGIKFRFKRLKEKKTYYGKTFLHGFSAFLDDENPDIIVTIWPYVLGFLFYPLLWRKIKSKGIKLIYKDIPFRIPKFREALKYKNASYEDESLNLHKPTPVGYLSNVFVTFLRMIYYKRMDAHVNYVEEAVEILGSYGVSREKIFITYNSPDTDMLFKAKEKALISEPILPVNPYRIIHVGRLVKWKKVHLLISAINILKEKFNKIELIVIGTGPEEKELKSQTGKLNLSDRILFVGPVYDPVVLAGYLISSSVYVLAGMGGLSINEAMAVGKPVVCSVCDGTEKNLVIDDYNGKFFKENDVNDLADKIGYILSDSGRIKRMGENSGKIISEKINIHTVVNRYESAFKYVIKNGQGK